MGKVIFSNRQILIDGKAEHIRAGAMHYFRLLPPQWKSRIAALKSCGLNTLETYMPWSFHEKNKGEFDFSGGLDISAYLRLAAEAGLYVILRPGPYVCSELDLGGLPAWLLTENCRLRSSEKTFMEYAKRYLHKVFEEVKPLLYTNGGPIIAVQIENEYIGNDLEYMEQLRDFFIAEGIDVPLMASNGPGEVTCSLPSGVIASVNGRNHPLAMCSALANARPDDPPFVMELWNGHGQYWGDDFVEHTAEDVAADVREAMKEKIHFNLYMFHGGTTFGFMNGSGGGFRGVPYQSLLTSYDVDGTLPEGGRPGAKFYAVRNEILKAMPELKLEDPPIPETRAYGEIKLTEAVPLLDSLESLSTPVVSVRPLSFEELKCSYGFVLYRFRAEKDGIQSVVLHELRDRAQIFVKGSYCGTLYRNDPPGKNVRFKAAKGDNIDILVENCGRLRNTVADLQRESKGIGEVMINGIDSFRSCECFPLALEDLSALRFRSSEGFSTDEPAFYRGYLDLDAPADTFIRIPAGSRGVLWVNGFNAGRYNNAGPQYTLYVPGELLKKGRNEFVVLELEHLGMNMLWSQNEPDMGRRVKMIQ